MPGHCSSVGVPSSVEELRTWPEPSPILLSPLPSKSGFAVSPPQVPRISEDPLQLVIHIVARKEGPPCICQLWG